MSRCFYSNYEDQIHPLEIVGDTRNAHSYSELPSRRLQEGSDE